MYNRYMSKGSLFSRDPTKPPLQQQQQNKRQPQQQMIRGGSQLHQTQLGGGGVKGQVNVMSGSSGSSLSSRLASALPGGPQLQQMQIYRARTLENDDRFMQMCFFAIDIIIILLSSIYLR